MAKLLPKGDKKLLHAWAFYDWANSAYSLVIASAVFPIFFDALFPSDKKLFALGIEWGKSSSVIFFVTVIAFSIISLISPILSGVADFLGNKRFFLKFFCYMGALCTIGLIFFDVNNVNLGLLFYLFALVGFWASLVFYNSYLPDIAHPEQHDAISAKGYSLGYMGSVLLLSLCLGLILFYEVFGFENEILPMKISFGLTGIWWIGFSQYTYAYLPKGNKADGTFSKDILFKGFNELRNIWEELKQQLILKRYLGAFFIYSMGVQTVMLAASYFGAQELNWGNTNKSFGLIISILLIQLIAIVGALLTSRLSAKVGNIKALIYINLLWIMICAWSFFVYTPIQFYITAVFVGLVMGGIQSLSRSTYAKFLPETEDTTSYFSFYDVSEKVGIIIGMFLFLLMQELTGSMRYSIIFLILFFGAGVLLLLRVPKKE